MAYQKNHGSLLLPIVIKISLHAATKKIFNEWKLNRCNKKNCRGGRLWLTWKLLTAVKTTFSMLGNIRKGIFNKIVSSAMPLYIFKVQSVTVYFRSPHFKRDITKSETEQVKKKKQWSCIKGAFLKGNWFSFFFFCENV